MPQSSETEVLLFATYNPSKLEQMSRLLAPLGLRVIGAADFGLEAPEETETSFAGNALIKARAAAKATGRLALADDSGLCVDALRGAPGIHTADWAETPSGRNFSQAMRRIHDILIEFSAQAPWTAQVQTVLALFHPDGREEIHEGRIEGRFTWPPRGESFGLEPVFQPRGETRSLAEMSPEEKDAISHRTLALRSLLAGPILSERMRAPAEPA